MRFFRAVVYVFMLLAIFSYLFWRVDAIPDVVNPFFGFVDDAVLAIIVVVFGNRIIRNLEGKK